jgi:hypothetical protein
MTANLTQWIANLSLRVMGATITHPSGGFPAFSVKALGAAGWNTSAARMTFPFWIYKALMGITTINT